MNLNRKELYELVWSKPMVVLAKEYGFSDNGFAKICRRHQIPIPPRGYWAKKAAGLDVPIISLPVKNENVMVYIETRNPISDQDISNRQEKLTQEKSEIEKIGEIKVPSQLTDPHKYTVSTQAHFDKIIKKINAAKASTTLPKNLYDFYDLMHRGRIDCHQNNCYKVTVSESLVNRALIFLDTLVKELEFRGFKIQPNKDENTVASIIAIKDQEKIIIHISEGYKYQPLDKKSKKLSPLEELLYSGKEPVPTGKLTFSVHTVEARIGRNWSDGKRLIEEMLPTIIHEFNSLIPRLKQHRIEEEVKRKQRLVEQEIFREREAQRYRERSIYDEVMKEAKAFNDYVKLETYLSHLEQILVKHSEGVSDGALNWLATARVVANEENPINERIRFLVNLQ